MSEPREHIAGALVATSWGGWFFSHVDDLNKALQMILLLVSIASGLIAMRFYWKRTR